MTAEVRLSAAAAAEWARHLENILGGVAHAINNRAAALAASTELVRGDPADVAAALDLSAAEARRLAQLAHAIRTLDPGDGGEQAFAPADAAAEALAVLELHRAFRHGGPAIEARDAPPVRTWRPVFVRALVVLAAHETAATPANSAREPLALRLEGDWLVVEAGGGGRGAITPLASELAAAMGGEPLPDGRYGIRIPTLEAIRRREGR